MFPKNKSVKKNSFITSVLLILLLKHEERLLKTKIFYNKALKRATTACQSCCSTERKIKNPKCFRKFLHDAHSF